MSSASRKWLDEADKSVGPRPSAGRVLCFAWNESGSTLAVGTSDSFSLYSTEPRGRTQQSGGSFTEVACRRVRGGVGHIALFGQSNMLLISGAQDQTCCTAKLWDDSQAEATSSEVLAAQRGIGSRTKNCVVAEITLATPIVAMRLHTHCIVIAEEAYIHVLNDRLETVQSYATPSNLASLSDSAGLRGLTIGDNSIALASIISSSQYLSLLILGPQLGSIRCLKYHVGKKRVEQFEGILTPHTRPIRTLAITPDGTLGASISENGTAIKLIDVPRATPFRQLNRGTTSNAVWAMSFNPEGSLLSCLSETGTIHFYAVSPPVPMGSGGGVPVSGNPSGKLTNPKSKLSMLSSALDYVTPSAISESKWVVNAKDYATGENAVATFSLGVAAGGAPVADDIENETADAFSNVFAALACCPSHVGVQGNRIYYTFVAQGNDESFLADSTSGIESAQGVVGFSGPRCKLVKIALSLDSHGVDTSRVSTHYFPKEEL
jgi:WD40 repeat protein